MTAITKIPQAITARLDHIDNQAHNLHEVIRDDRRELRRLVGSIREQRRQLYALQIERRALMFAVKEIAAEAHIERHMDFGSVAEVGEPISPKVVRVAEEVRAAPRPVSEPEPSRKDRVLAAIKDLGGATPTEIQQKIGEPALRTYLGVLSRDGAIERNAEGKLVARA